MTNRKFLMAAVAVLALGACNKGSHGSQATADNTKVTITQAKPPAGGTWADVVNQTSAGYVMGNPDAKVKLVEIGSLSCPHCQKFEMEGSQQLIDKYVKSGNVSWEFRPYLIHGAIDVAADLLVRCNGGKTFFPLMKALYTDQPVWMAKLETAPKDKLDQIQNLPPNQSFVQMASLLGLQDWAAARGVPVAKSNQCLSDQKMIDNEVQVSADVNNQYPDFEGTPTFILNGTMQPKEVATWPLVEAKLQEALK
jgi:protein-disulfide isomerase